MYKGKELTGKIYDIIAKDWPIHASGVCRKLNILCSSSNISKVKYHFGILEKSNRIITKKLDRALVAWPYEIEKIRVMQELIKES